MFLIVVYIVTAILVFLLAVGYFTVANVLGVVVIMVMWLVVSDQLELSKRTKKLIVLNEQKKKFIECNKEY